MRRQRCGWPPPPRGRPSGALPLARARAHRAAPPPKCSSRGRWARCGARSCEDHGAGAPPRGAGVPQALRVRRGRHEQRTARVAPASAFHPLGIRRPRARLYAQGPVVMLRILDGSEYILPVFIGAPLPPLLADAPAPPPTHPRPSATRIAGAPLGHPRRERVQQPAERHEAAALGAPAAGVRAVAAATLWGGGGPAIPFLAPLARPASKSRRPCARSTGRSRTTS